MRTLHKVQWSIVTVLVALVVYVISAPFIYSTVKQVYTVNGELDLSKVNLVKSGPVMVKGTLRYIPNQIVYDDENFEMALKNSVSVPAEENLPEDIYGRTGYGTYVLKVRFRKSHPLIGMQMPEVASNYKLWVNGHLVGQKGRVGLTKQVSVNTMLRDWYVLNFDQDTPYSDHEMTIVIQTSNYSAPQMGLNDSLIIGTSEQITRMQVNAFVRETMIVLIALLVGLYHIVASTLQETSKAMLYFGLFTTMLSVRTVFYGERILFRIMPWIDYPLGMQLGLFATVMSMLLLFRYVIMQEEEKEYNALQKGVIFLIIMAYFLRAITYNIPTQGHWAWVLSIFSGILLVYLFQLIVMNFRNSRLDMRLASTGMLVSIFLVVIDSISGGDEAWTRYALIIFIFTQTLALGHRLAQSFKLNQILTAKLKVSATALANRNLELDASKKELEKLNSELDEKVTIRTEDLKILIDHVGQAFFAIDDASIILPGYSRLTEDFLGSAIEGQNVWNLMIDDSEERGIFEKAIARIFDEKSDLRRDGYLAVLPERLELNGRILRAEYKYIHTELKKQIMIIMTDISYEEALSDQMEQEVRDSRSNFRILLNAKEFWELYDEMKAFFKQGAYQMIDQEFDLDYLKRQLGKKVHGFKGNLSMFGVEKAVRRLHELEERFQDDKELTRQELKTIIGECSAIEEIKIRINRISFTEGVNIYAYKDAVLIPKKKLTQIASELSGDDRFIDIVDDLQTLTYKPFRNLLDPFVDYVTILGLDRGKKVNPVQIVGGNFIVNPAPYEAVIKALTHAFRNMVDHGIEVPEIRYERGKSAYGNITIRIQKEDKVQNTTYIRMEISDDGNGLEREKIMNAAEEVLDLNPEELKSLPDHVIYDFIFEPRVSTTAYSDIVSGRGLGMMILKDAIMDIGGTIQIESVPMQETTVIIRLPLIQ